jgi:hypothetical protein
METILRKSDLPIMASVASSSSTRLISFVLTTPIDRAQRDRNAALLADSLHHDGRHRGAVHDRGRDLDLRARRGPRAAGGPAVNTLPSNENGRDEGAPRFTLAVFVDAVAGFALCAASLWAEREEGATS